MITHLHVKNFKCHRDTALDLSPLTCLVGPNGAGKSSLLKLLLEIGTGRVPQKAPGQPLEFELIETIGGNPIGPISPQGFRSFAVRSLRLRPEAISRPSAPASLPPQMDESGGGLPSVIADLILSDPERFASLVATIRSVIPGVLGLRARLVQVHGNLSGHELLFDMIGKSGLPAVEVSDGTLIVTALLTALHLDSAEMFLLDDLEQGLHPAAQRELVQVLRRLVQTRPETQIVFTTHSPYVVDELEPAEVVVLNLDPAGNTVAKSLKDHPDVERALSVLTTGEFLAAEGESWVLDPAKAEPE